MDDTCRVLEDVHERTLRRLARLTGDFDDVVAASRDTNADDEHDPEGATIAFERSQVDALIHRAQTQLLEVDAAVARLDAGRYGTCEGCPGPVGEERLEAMPLARLCIQCARTRSATRS